MRITTRRRLSIALAIVVSLGLFWHLVQPVGSPPVNLEDLTSPPPQQEMLSTEDTYSPAKDFEQILNGPPVIIFSKSYCPYSKKAKHILLDLYSIQPEPKIVEIDLHPHGAELQAHIGETTGRRTVPNVLVSKQSRGGGDDMQLLHDTGVLVSRFEEWGSPNLIVKPSPAIDSKI